MTVTCTLDVVDARIWTGDVTVEPSAGLQTVTVKFVEPGVHCA